ncbi:MAG: acyl carrier protein [Deltaproteobacteria bacterium]|nr:acyl carrier protein [Deltaproteobacteria bacterium]
MTGQGAMGGPRPYPERISASDVASVLLEVAGIDAQDPDADLAAMGLDSLRALDLLAALEERFGLALAEDLAAEFRSVSRITCVVQDAMRYPQGVGRQDGRQKD